MSERDEFIVWVIDGRTLGHDCATCHGSGMERPSYTCGSCGGSGVLTISTVPWGHILIGPTEIAEIRRALVVLQAAKVWVEAGHQKVYPTCNLIAASDNIGPNGLAILAALVGESS